MAGMARLVMPNYPHHVTQRGNRRQKTFFCQIDYPLFLEMLSEEKDRDWDEYLSKPNSSRVHEDIRKNSRSGRPLGGREFVSRLERLTGRKLQLRRPGPKPG